MLTEEQLREIEAAEQEAEAAPWISNGSELYYGADGFSHQQIYYQPNAAFIAGARTWVPQLLAMVRELQRERDHFRNQIRDYAIEERGMNPEDIDSILDEGAREARDG